MRKMYKNHLINRDMFTGYYSARTKNGRVLADTLKGIKELINQNL